MGERLSSDGGWLRASQRVIAVVLLAVLVTEWTVPASAASRPSPPPIRLPGHVLDAVKNGAIPVAARPDNVSEPLTVTVVLRRSDQPGFERYLKDVYDRASPQSRKFLSQAELADRFGPSNSAYRSVREFLADQGLSLVEGSANRLTLTVRGTRAEIEEAFQVRISEYELGDRRFYATAQDPTLPASVGRYVQAISGLSNAAVPASPLKQATPEEIADCSWLIGSKTGKSLAIPTIALSLLLSIGAFFIPIAALAAISYGAGIGTLLPAYYCVGLLLGMQYGPNLGFGPRSAATGPQIAGARRAKEAVGPSSAQKIGLLEFDTFRLSDVQDWLALAGVDPAIANRVSTVAVNGGVASPGPGQSEVLLDLATVIVTDISPNVRYVVYHAPGNTSFQQLFNAMINDGVTVIANSWSQCEDQTSLAEAQSIDSVLAQAAASGVSVFNGSGDTGSTCLDGSPNTVGVPASSPHATAVGGTTPLPGAGYTYGGETWWDGSGMIPPTGQGGFGVSRHFASPAYQNGLTSSAMRSVPDIVLPADPRDGLALCEADAGGCPTGLLYGGTSMTAPAMAGMVARLNEVLGSNMGEANPVLYAQSGTRAFHSSASMGSDFAHVGLGSPHFNYLRLALSGQSIGPVSAAASRVTATPNIPADGATTGIVQVNLFDANGYPVSGKTVTLVPSVPNHVAISALSGPSDVHSGAVVFQITDLTAETVTFTATDATDGTVLQNTAAITFGVPAATSAGIVAAPASVAANGTSASTITVTLKDGLGRPTPGKSITLSQGNGHSIITGPSPAVTDANGQIVFTATDTVGEVVTYTAVDVSDGGLQVPGSATVTFTGGGTSCLPPPPTAANGFTLTPFANGFLAQNFFFGGINFVGCPGASNPAFDGSGSAFVADFPTGDLYKFGTSGGAVSSANKLSSLGKTFGNVVFGKDGSLYGSTFSPAAIVQVDPITGAIVRTVASGFACPAGLAIDPLSGDLFFDDNCVGGIQNASLWRVQNPGSASPAVVVYSTLPGFANGQISFAPDGTLYVVVNAFNNENAPIVRISGTNTPAPHDPVAVQGITADTGGLAIGEVQANGAAKSLIVHTGGAAGGAGGSLKVIDLATLSATVLANGLVEPGVVGPDGCMYVNSHDTILKLAPSSGGCAFNPTNPAPTLVVTPATVSPNPAQGTARIFTATFKNANVPAGTPVTFRIGDANPRMRLVRTDANGVASVTYTGVFTGTDTVVASATLGGVALTSNAASVTWAAGRHVTSLTLNLSPTVGTTGQPVTLQAALVDVSQDPPAPVAGGSITLAIGNQTCVATTNAQGNASCSINVPSGTPLTLSANFAGNAQFAPASAAELFRALGAVAAAPPGAPTITGTTSDNGVTRIFFNAPASDGGSPITGYSATCTPVGGGASVTATGTDSPITVAGLVNGTTYTCTVSAMNASGTGPPSAVSQAFTASNGPTTPIPAVNHWMLIILAMMLGMLALTALRRRL